MGQQVDRSDLSSLQLRIISAVILAPVAIAALVLGGRFFFGFVLAIALVMCWEWSKTCLAPLYSMASILTFAAVLLALIVSLKLIPVFSFIVLGLGSLLVLIVRLLRKQTWRLGAFGPFYIGLPCLSLLWMRNIENVGFSLTMSLFLVVWATDIGAYFSGKIIGGAKIAPSISPNKTWAGLIGGATAASLTAVAANYWLIQLDLPMILLALLGALMAVLAQVGDFFESGWKRLFHIKDASNIIPGHGGVLDRMDGVLFVAPVLFFALFMLLDITK